MEKHLKLNQQIALLPATIPDSILDFLEDFSSAKNFATENSVASLDPEYLKAEGESLKTQIAALKTELGALQGVAVEQAGRDSPGAYLIKLGFEKGEKGMIAFTRLKERTIFRLLFQEGAYSEEGLKQLLKTPK